MARFIFTTGGSFNMEFEDLTSQVDGDTAIFTTNVAFKAISLGVYYNGQLQTGQVTIINTTQFQLNFSPAVGTFIEVVYSRL